MQSLRLEWVLKMKFKKWNTKTNMAQQADINEKVVQWFGKRNSIKNTIKRITDGLEWMPQTQKKINKL